jgi:predicted Fe-Mo cluster-binding NifX family protein
VKIAISSSGQTPGSQVDPRFGRAAFFIVVDTDTGAFEAHDNLQNLNAAQGAGIQAARCVVDLGAGTVLTGHVGPKAFAALQAAGVKIFVGAAGTVREAVEQYKAGQLDEASEATVEGHWM